MGEAMLRLLSPPRIALALLGALLAAVAFAGRAEAEEAIVLDNGTVLRGNVVTENDHTIVFRLAGVGTDNRLTIERKHVTQRFVTVDPARWAALTRRFEPTADPLPEPVDLSTAAPTAPLVAPARPPLPAEEPTVQEESIFARVARRAVLAFPTDATSRFLLPTPGLGAL